jgi:hypothetical protein
MFMTSLFYVINNRDLDVYDVAIRRRKHEELRSL